tara:strand:- start:4504 stop:4749 length:246 start_codon:yes stop_codon:yes gene_type:complete
VEQMMWLYKQLKEIKMNCQIHSNVELIPHIFTDTGIVQYQSCIIEEHITPRIVYWANHCPVCTQWHWGEIYEEYGSYFILE